ncbi:MAG: hypothetical protein ABI678_11425 [Kofleriaceae bacterium]
MAKPVTHAESGETRFDAIDRRLDAVDDRLETLTDSIGQAIAEAIVTIDQNFARHVRASEERLRLEIRAMKFRIELSRLG